MPVGGRWTVGNSIRCFTSVSFALLPFLGTVFASVVNPRGDLSVPDKIALFLAAPSYAVVGASDDASKFGTIVLNTMLEKGMNAVPVNPFVSTSEGISCLNSLADLPDPAHTSVSVITQPSVSLSILQQATALGVPMVWLQPGAQDAAVLAYIANATGGTNFIYTDSPDTRGPCSIGDPDVPDVISMLLA
ncbi:CoA binding domain-containing protein [Mycena amicta]|nr:CoA binding domain-containing protein [Mycena amicta]